MIYKIVNGAISFDGNTILEEINFEINKNDHIAIVGRNGCGKTSLLNAIVNEDMLETGLNLEKFSVIKIGNPTIGFQRQETFDNLEVTLLDEILKSYEDVILLKKKIEKLEKELSVNVSDKILNDYTMAIERYKIIGGYTYQKEYELALNKFGFAKDDKYKKLSEFSGGQRTKLAFLKLLLSKPDILLLDEPTNHLDIVTVEWLEEYLKNYPKAFVVVSHDRMFLDNVVNKVYEIEFASLNKYSGNYSTFEKQKKLNYEKQLKDYEYQQKEIKRLQEIANRFKYKPSKASMAMSKLRKIEQMVIVEKPQKANTKNFDRKIKVANESGNNILSVRDLEIGYNNVSLSKVSFELYKGQKIAVIGSNGIGKSTFLKTIMGLIPKISGKFTFGYNVEKEYFDQQIEFLNNKNTVYEEFGQTFKGLEPLEIRKALGAFMFSGNDVFKEISVLSGGEKVRLALCKIFNKRPNLLLLDEPTNHLDILGKENLENILLNYEGTVLFVSHDRYFVNKVADGLLIFENGNVSYYNGTYSSYLEYKRKETTKIQQENVVVLDKVIKKEKPRNLNHMVSKLEKEISILEEKKKTLESLLYDENVYTDYEKFSELQDNIKELNEKIEVKYLEWEELNS